MKNKLRCRRAFCLGRSITGLMVVFYFIRVGTSLGAAEYANCADIAIIKSFHAGTKSLADIETSYKNFITMPKSGITPTVDAATNTNIPRTDLGLFTPVRKNGELESTFLTCGFSSNSVMRCENSRMNTKTCTFTVKINDKNETIDNCVKFDIQKGLEGKSGSSIACYPVNHICNKYSTKIFNDYFPIDESRFGIINNGENSSANVAFYLYKKNVLNDGSNKNCELTKFSCDYRVKSESPAANEINVIFSNCSNENKDFYNNIFAGMGDKAFFKYVGQCTKNESTCKTILESYAYYKYVNKNNSTINNSDVIYYFAKNIRQDNLGVVCNKYLPNCKEDPRVANGDFSRVLYNDMSVENSNSDNPQDNFSARVGFYAASLGISNNTVNVSNEANLWYANNSYFVNVGCLAVAGMDGENSDIGYCSDLNDTMSDLKYKDGLEKTKGKVTGGIKGESPNCYLKSCIDLTAAEFKMIKDKGSTTKKYCSEYFWLSNKYGFKYFPKEKPLYCSDLASGSNPSNLKLTFANKTYEQKECPNNSSGQPDFDDNGNCRQTTAIKKFSYGGGLNETRDNCYLKNCYSLRNDERDAVSMANVANAAEELKRAYAIGVTDGKETEVDKKNIPRYCDDGFLFNINFTGFEKFNYFDLNIIPCFFFSADQISAMDSRSPIDFTNFLLNSHNYEDSVAFCRTHYLPLNTIEKSTAKKHSQDGSFLEFMLTIADERTEYSTKSTYKSYLDGKISSYNSKTISNFSSLAVFLENPSGSTYKSSGKKVPFSNGKLGQFSGSTIVNGKATKMNEDIDRNSYHNVCTY
ncbi:MAG: hypothetical protein LBP39_01145, partial [Rickettsiales bacterium]|nr:hypothetical protein [Rickettsiales bacterium]